MLAFASRHALPICWVALLLACSIALGQDKPVPSAGSPSALHGLNQAAGRRRQREQWFTRGRVLPGGRPAAELRAQAYLKKIQMRRAALNRRLARGSGASISGGWTSLGPVPLASDASGVGIQDYGWVAGRATAVAIDTADPTGNTVYVGGAYGGLWKSSNAGPLSPNPSTVIWTPLIDSQATLAVGAIAIQPQLSNPDPAKSVILVGTGETNNSADSYYGLGILRYDGIGSWGLISQDISGTHQFAGLGFSKIAFSTANPNLVVAAASVAIEGVIEGLENPPNVNRGIYYSTNGGVSWTYAGISDGANAIDPGSATSVVYDAAANEFLAAVSWHGFYSSSDGAHWTRLANQPGTQLSAILCPSHTAFPSTCPIFRGELTVTRNEIYAWFVDSNDTDGGIWQSLDGGATWTQISDAGITSCGDLFGGCGTEQGTYNLALEAIPNGMATDLYAGAVNIYKCTINQLVRDCTGTGPNSFVNLTHVYGCSSIAKVHPSQHATASMLLNNSGQALIYFANDGGLYRALDGYTGLTSGSCGASNQFDDMNETLGSMTQFVSFSQSSTNSDIFLGGAVDDGSPATAAAEGNPSWTNVMAGDGGYNAINPGNDSDWFIASPPDSGSGVNIFRCLSGINCHTLDFQNNQVVRGSDVGGDTGPFFLPYILDPQSPGELLLGTCRIWRGPSGGGVFTAVSTSFEDGGSGACSGSEVNLVRAIAAGGIPDTSGLSTVIYAGTDGLGSLIPTSPNGGRLWVTTNAPGGTSSWSDRTSIINPGNFPISSVALDASDTIGMTAYITVMGFHVPHVWKTSDAGVTWTNFTLGLPDAPANAIVVDPGSSSSSGALYVGTDVGVFSSSTSALGWTEVGPAPSSGSVGYLPNAPVTALHILNSGGTKRLRASTYGRGIWEFNLSGAPDFQVAVNSATAIAFGPQTATFFGTLTSLNGYGRQVTFSCTSEAPVPLTTCIAPGPITPSSSGTTFVLTAGGAIGDYLFNLQSIGAGAATSPQSLPLALHVVDFNLSAPSPGSVSIGQSGTSAAVTFQATAAGSFNQTIDFSCTGLPASTGCSFQPSTSVNPTSAAPVTITLSIVTGAGAPLGSYSIGINATTANGPTKSQRLLLSITNALPDFSLAVTNPTVNANVGAAGMFNGTLTALSGYASTVTLACGTGAPPSCAATPSSLTPAADGSSFTVAASSNISQSYPFNIVAQDSSGAQKLSAVTFTATGSASFDFSIVNNSGGQTVLPGQSASYDLNVIPVPAQSQNVVLLSCAGLPPQSTCTITPSQLTFGTGAVADATLIVTTAAASALLLNRSNNHSIYFLAFGFPLPGLLVVCKMRLAVSRRVISLLFLALVVSLLSSELACGGGLHGNGTASGSLGNSPNQYSVIVTGTSGSLSHSIPLTLVVQ